ncbi:MAG TPA: aminotransferase class I/II-fold pyridoxal phosphate-dependent enzyme [Acidobacteriota bacterium]|nr:aminotransferase class I/II-fold pyridoxal phosphate-dependent enzyme [Acidobacteriota bacterium]
MPKISKKAEQFTESVIREMTRLCQLHNGINLSQGFPDFSAPEEMKEAARKAISDNVNQYAITWGAKNLRNAIAEKTARFNGFSLDPEKNVTVCCGATEAMISTILATVNPGEEVIVFEPYYENYGPDTILSGAVPRLISLHEPDWRFDFDELESLFNNKTRAIIINTPNNPTGKIFSREELEFIAKLCLKWDAIAITDEIYEHILYEGRKHISMASLPGMSENTVTINAASKTYSVTGWRVGYAIASAELTSAIRKVHDFLTVGAPAPLQEAVAVAMHFPDSYYTNLSVEYLERRDLLMSGLESAGFRCYKPYGAYYIMTDISVFGFPDDTTFARTLVKDVGVATVPGSSFYQNPRDGYNKVRFAFCKKMETLRRALEVLANLPQKLKVRV